MFKLDPEDARLLDELKSSYRIVHSRISQDNGTERQYITGEIIDRLSQKVWASGEHSSSELEAVRNGIQVALNGERPKTVAERVTSLSAENEELRRKIEILEGRSGTARETKSSQKIDKQPKMTVASNQ